MLQLRFTRKVKKVDPYRIVNIDLYGNPSPSIHTPGRKANIKIARSQGNVLPTPYPNADPEEIIFTAGGSESNNTVLKYIICNPARGCDKSCCSLGGRNEIMYISCRTSKYYFYN